MLSFPVFIRFSFFRKFGFFGGPDFGKSLIYLTYFLRFDPFLNPPHTHTKHFFVRFWYFALQMTQNIKIQKAMAPQRLKCGYNYKETFRGGWAYLVWQVLSFGSYSVVSVWFAGTLWQWQETGLLFIQSSHPGGMLCRVFTMCYGRQVGF